MANMADDTDDCDVTEDLHERLDGDEQIITDEEDTEYVLTLDDDE